MRMVLQTYLEHLVVWCVCGAAGWMICRHSCHVIHTSPKVVQIFTAVRHKLSAMSRLQLLLLAIWCNHSTRPSGGNTKPDTQRFPMCCSPWNEHSIISFQGNRVNNTIRAALRLKYTFLTCLSTVTQGNDKHTPPSLSPTDPVSSEQCVRRGQKGTALGRFLWLTHLCRAGTNQEVPLR